MAEQPRSIVLLVDAERQWASSLLPIIEASGYSCTLLTDFPSARRELHAHPPEALITNIRLGAFNGIHLAYLARMSERSIRVMVYACEHDRLLAAEVRAAGAFYERKDFVPFALKAFLGATLPERDRRTAGVVDRRAAFRGGRRTTDTPVLHAAITA